jgi:hypothetical protein
MNLDAEDVVTQIEEYVETVDALLNSGDDE